MSAENEPKVNKLPAGPAEGSGSFAPLDKIHNDNKPIFVENGKQIQNPIGGTALPQVKEFPETRALVETELKKIEEQYGSI